MTSIALLFSNPPILSFPSHSHTHIYTHTPILPYLGGHDNLGLLPLLINAQVNGLAVRQPTVLERVPLHEVERLRGELHTTHTAGTLALHEEGVVVLCVWEDVCVCVCIRKEREREEDMGKDGMGRRREQYVGTDDGVGG